MGFRCAEERTFARWNRLFFDRRDFHLRTGSVGRVVILLVEGFGNLYREELVLCLIMFVLRMRGIG